MPCYHPQRVALDEHGNLDWSIYDPVPDIHEIVLVPCRRCVGCRSSEAREWAIRCYHEALFHWKPWRDPITKVTTEVPNTSVATLTYDDENLPEGGLLRPGDLQKFLKRLRNRREKGSIRFFASGEYGDTPTPFTPAGRPHYHIILFGEDFRDRYEFSDFRVDGSGAAKPLHGSYELDRLWKLGRATLDDVSLEAVRYVCGYVNKKAHDHGKLTGPLAEAVHESTGQLRVVPLQPEYRVMSKKPGLGRHWIERNFEHVYPVDEIVINGQTFPPPSFYDRWLKANHPVLYREVQDKRLDKRLQAQIDLTPERLASAKEIVLAGKQRKQAI